MFCSSVITRLFVPVAQTDFEPRKMQTDAIYEPLSSRSSDKSIASDHRLDRSSAVLPNRSRKFEAHKSNAVPLLQSASAVNSDKMMCESIPANGSIGLPSNCNVAAHSPGRPADAVCSSNCTKLTTMDLTSRIKLSDKCSCVRARHATANCFANCSASNQSSFKLCAKRSSAIHADPTHRDHTDRSVNCLNSSKDKCMDKSPASRPAKRCTPATNRSAHRSSNESSIKSSKSSSKRSLNSPIDAPSHHSSSSQLSSLIRILTSFSRSSLSFTRTHQSLLVPLLLVLCTVIRMSGKPHLRSDPLLELLKLKYKKFKQNLHDPLCQTIFFSFVYPYGMDSREILMSLTHFGSNAL